MLQIDLFEEAGIGKRSEDSCVASVNEGRKIYDSRETVGEADGQTEVRKRLNLNNAPWRQGSGAMLFGG